jgi:hypothetical protein
MQWTAQTLAEVFEAFPGDNNVVLEKLGMSQAKVDAIMKPNVPMALEEPFTACGLP